MSISTIEHDITSLVIDEDALAAYEREGAVATFARTSDTELPELLRDAASALETSAALASLAVLGIHNEDEEGVGDGSRYGGPVLHDEALVSARELVFSHPGVAESVLEGRLETWLPDTSSAGWSESYTAHLLYLGLHEAIRGKERAGRDGWFEQTMSCSVLAERLREQANLVAFTLPGGMETPAAKALSPQRRKTIESLAKLESLSNHRGVLFTSFTEAVVRVLRLQEITDALRVVQGFDTLTAETVGAALLHGTEEEFDSARQLLPSDSYVRFALLLTEDERHELRNREPGTPVSESIRRNAGLLPAAALA